MSASAWLVAFTLSACVDSTATPTTPAPSLGHALEACPVSQSVEPDPDASFPADHSERWYRSDDGELWMSAAQLFAGGPMKLGWRKPADAQSFTVTGERLDAPAPQLEFSHPPLESYGNHFLASAIRFPTPGCWSVSARADDSSLEVVVFVYPATFRLPTADCGNFDEAAGEADAVVIAHTVGAFPALPGFVWESYQIDEAIVGTWQADETVELLRRSESPAETGAREDSANAGGFEAPDPDAQYVILIGSRNGSHRTSLCAPMPVRGTDIELSPGHAGWPETTDSLRRRARLLSSTPATREAATRQMDSGNLPAATDDEIKATLPRVVSIPEPSRAAETGGADRQQAGTPPEVAPPDQSPPDPPPDPPAAQPTDQRPAQPPDVPLRELSSSELRRLRSDMLALVNAERRRVGLPPYRVDSRLETAAQAHALDLVGGDAEVHVGSDGRGATERIRDAGYAAEATDWRVGENIAGGATAFEAIEWLMEDPPHRRNVLHPLYSEIGIGVALTRWGRYTFVMDLGYEN